MKSAVSSPTSEQTNEDHAEPPTILQSWIAFGGLVVALVGVVLLAKQLSPMLEAGVVGAGLPVAVVGVVMVLAPIRD